MLFRAGAGAPAPVSLIPPTAPGRLASEFLSDFNDGRDQALETLLLKFPMTPFPASVYAASREMRGALSPVRVVRSSPEKLELEVRYQLFDEYRLLTVSMQHGDLGLPASLVLGRAAEHKEVRLRDHALAADTQKRLNLLGDRFSGAVLIYHNGRVVLRAARGFEDKAAGIRNTPTTRFRIASMGKMFTAVGIMQLEQAGKLKLDAPVSTYLPAYPNQALAHAVTVRQLLNHTGGTGDIFGPEYEARRSQLRTLQDYVTLYGSRSPAFPPGTRWEYSNYGYIILGRVIEEDSREHYDDYVYRHIFSPASMSETGFEPETTKVARRAIPYAGGNDGYTSVSDTIPYRGTSAGGGYSTVDDLGRFALALEKGDLVSPSRVALLTTGTAQTSPTMNYGLGFGDEIVNGVHAIGHSGAAAGMNGDLLIMDGGKEVIVVISNFGPMTAVSLAEYICARADR